MLEKKPKGHSEHLKSLLFFAVSGEVCTDMLFTSFREIPYR